MDIMEGNSSVVSVMDRVSSDVGFSNSTNSMEMKWISSKLESLTDISKLAILESADEGFITVGVKHDVGTILVFS
jgi:hypothetical protein